MEFHAGRKYKAIGMYVLRTAVQQNQSALRTGGIRNHVILF